jgi:hypothetical protein
MIVDFEQVFAESFDTFKVLDNLNAEIVLKTLPGTPKNVWQILNHIARWQSYQVILLQGDSRILPPAETETWIKNVDSPLQGDINEVVNTIHEQLSKIKAVIAGLTLQQNNLQEKLSCIQEITNHFSFHLGEIVLIRRQVQNYPQPHEMNAFLA